MNITFALCGGTIEKVYSETEETTVFSTESDNAIQYVLENYVRPKSINIRYARILQKDSSHMTEEDRIKIADFIINSDTDKIVLTHGTSTMTQTAEFIMKKLKEKNIQKTILMTGAMRPHFLYGTTDSVANISAALMAVQIYDQGVFIAMNGRIFEAGTVIKNVQAGVFEEN